MRLRYLFLIAGLFLSLVAHAEKFVLSANPGEFNPKTLGPVSSRGSLSASFQLIKFNSSKAWPAAAYVGFYQGPNRDNSVQFLIIRNQETDNYVVAGYRVIEGGRQTKIESLANLPPDTAAQVSLSFEKSVVTLTLNNQYSRTFRVPMTEVTPYVSVSSGTAEFNVAP